MNSLLPNPMTVIGLNLLDSIANSSQYTSTSIENASEVLSRLKLIGCIHAGDKITIRNLTIQPDSWMTKFQRTFITRDNRRNAYEFISKVLSRTLEILNMLLIKGDDVSMNQVKHIIIDIINAKKGIKNIRETYSDDMKFICDIDILLQSIDANLLAISIKHPHIMPKIDHKEHLSAVPSLVVDMPESDDSKQKEKNSA